jgi:hypothetical protein
MNDSRLLRWLMAHPVATLLGMTLSFLLFGALSLDLARLLLANSRFLAEHGWDAVRDAALLQLAELLAKALLAMLGWVGLKLGEFALVQRLARGPAA